MKEKDGGWISSGESFSSFCFLEVKIQGGEGAISKALQPETWKGAQAPFQQLAMGSVLIKKRDGL